jgi:hypothetical protein
MENKGWLGQNALFLAGLGGEIVFNLILQKGWLDDVPDPLLGILCVIPLLLCVYGLWHHPSVQKFLHLLYNRIPKMLLTILMISGSALGATLGAFGYWTIKRQQQRQDKPTAEAQTAPVVKTVPPSPSSSPTVAVTPSPQPTPPATEISVPPTRPSSTTRKPRKKGPTAAELEERRRIDRDLNYNKPE